MTNPTLVLTARRNAVLAGVGSTADVLVRLQAPELPDGPLPERRPLHLALVIDRSGSMSGPPLAEARRCADFVVDGLRPDDQVAVISYDSEVATDWPLTPPADKPSIHRAIARIHERGMTNLHGGWLEGAGQLAPVTRSDVLSRVILLSDGQANEGLTDVDAIAAQCAELAEAGVTTSTYGLGHHFNEDLMVAMARSGQGNSYYGETAEDLMDPFREELALLEALCARRVDLKIETPLGIGVEILNGYALVEPGVWRLPDLAYAGEAWAVVRLTIEDGVATEGASMHLMKVSARWQDPEGQQGAVPDKSLELPAMPAAAYAAVAESSLVAKRVQELTMANLQDAARIAARRHDWANVDRVLHEAEEMAQGNPWLQETLETLRGIAAERDAVMLSKESLYSSQRMRTRLSMSVDEPGRTDLEMPEYLRRKRAQGRAAPREKR